MRSFTTTVSVAAALRHSPRGSVTAVNIKCIVYGTLTNYALLYSSRRLYIPGSPEISQEEAEEKGKKKERKANMYRQNAFRKYAAPQPPRFHPTRT